MFKSLLFLSFILSIWPSYAMAKDKATWVSKNYDQTFATGLVVPTDWRLHANFQSAIRLGQELPAHFDLREKGQLSPIENQGNCGSCWAFSATRTFQDALSLAGAPLNLSEQYLVSCNKDRWGCNGGWWAHDYHKTPYGGVDEPQFPYVAQDVPCKSGLTYKAQINGWSYLSAGESGISPVDEIKSAIFNYGTISVAVAADSNFQSYSSGIFNTCTARQVNHAVNLIGWDDEGQYWIMANSWGTGWGEQGYMRIKWGCDQIGYSANFIKYKKDGPQPPPPTPTPTPTPPPGPGPDPCLPFVDAGGDVIARRGSTIVIGLPPVSGVTYQWYKDRTALDGWNTSRIRVKLGNTVGIRLIELRGTSDNCGSDSDKLRIIVR